MKMMGILFFLGRSIIAFLAASIVILQSSAAEPEVSEADLPRVPPTPPEKALSTFKVKPGFKVELVAAEPLVVDPIALCFDEDSRMYVIEMRDYSERQDERLGRIRLLEDTDGDGRMDKSTVYAEGLPWPTALLCYDGGLFVGSTPDIYYFKDTNADGKADVKKTVFTGFGSQVQRLNVQQLFNSFNWSLDNRIHGATGGNGGVITCPVHPEFPKIDLRNSDFSFDPKTLLMRLENGGGQYGLSFDNGGRKFVCSNSSHIREVMYENRYLTADMTYAMPPAPLDIPVDGPAAEVYRTSPDEPWRVIRTKWRVSGVVPGPIEGGGRPSGYFTGATGLTIYRGDALGDDFVGDAFIGDAGSNLVHRKKLRPSGVAFKAERPEDEQKTEFLTSTDNWFRPVQFANAPDGALYICDMYREVIEHPWSLPPGIKKHLDLNSGNDRGRIYRVVAEKYQQSPLPKLSGSSTTKLVEYLAHPNGWHRDTAARLLYERQDKSAVEPLRYLLRTTHSVQGQIHALYALASLRSMDQEDLFIGFQSPYADLRENALRVSDSLPMSRALLEKYQYLLDDSSPRVRFQLAWTFSAHPELNNSLAMLRLAQKAIDPWEKHAILAVISRDPGRFFRAVNAGLPLDILSQASYLVGLKGDLSASASVLTYLVNLKKPEEQLPAGANLLRGLQKSKPDLVLSTARELDLSTNLAQQIVSAQAASPLLEDAIVVLCPDYIPANRQKILAYLSPKIPSEIQIEVIKALTQNSPQTAASALGFWPQLTPSIRTAFIDGALGQPRLAGALLNAVQSGTISRSEFSPAQISRLRSGSKSNAQLADKLFAQANQTSRAEAIRQYQPALQLAGDAAKGKMVFTNLCSSCHRLYGVGNAVGPDLESVRSSGKEALLANIIDPNREVPPRFATYEIQTTNGEDLSGILASESAAGYTLKQANGVETFVPRNQVAKIRSTGKSLMPEGLESELTPEGFASLLAYLLSQ